ncbi:MAG: hypothetical protein QM802_05060 [Agriterribacter sp.]
MEKKLLFNKRVLTFLTITLALNGYCQTNLDVNNILIDSIYRPDRLAQKFHKKEEMCVKHLGKDSMVVTSHTWFNKEGIIVKDIQYYNLDSFTKTVTILPGNIFVVAYMADAKTLFSQTYFSEFPKELEKAKKENWPFILRITYILEADSSFAIIKEANGERMDSSHYTPYDAKKEMLNDSLYSYHPPKDSSYSKDTLIVMSVDDVSNPAQRKISKLYYLNKGVNCVKEAYTIHQGDSLVHQGLVKRQYDKKNRLIYTSEHIGPPWRTTRIERTTYNQSGGRTEYIYHMPSSSNPLPDQVYKYNKDGLMIEAGGKSYLSPTIHAKTIFQYSTQGLLLKEKAYRNEKLISTVVYERKFY